MWLFGLKTGSGVFRRRFRFDPRRISSPLVLWRSPGREVSITVIAALLTLAGYSINDTIVIFDRIRENIRLRGRSNKETLEELINRSCNETLSRTIITSADGVSWCSFVCLFLAGKS
jgi:preprotein translocase SecF subunit